MNISEFVVRNRMAGLKNLCDYFSTKNDTGYGRIFDNRVDLLCEYLVTEALEQRCPLVNLMRPLVKKVVHDFIKESFNHHLGAFCSNPVEGYREFFSRQAKKIVKHAIILGE